MTSAQNFIVLAFGALAFAAFRARHYFPTDRWLARIFAILIATTVCAAGTVCTASLMIARTCGILMLATVAFLIWAIAQRQRHAKPPPKV